MSNGWPHLPNGNKNFKQARLQDAAGTDFGSVYLSISTLPIPGPIPAPSSSWGYPSHAPFPGDFPTKFASIAHEIGDALSDMNLALHSLHSQSMGGSSTPDPATVGRYLAAEKRLLVALNLSAVPICPLVPLNVSGKWRNGAYKPGQTGPDFVSTEDVPNPNFPNFQTALHFNAIIPGDNRIASGKVIFYQDCEWDADPPSNATAWMSWGFVTDFKLDLSVPETKDKENKGKGSSSSSSSSYYAASSAVPIQHPE